MRFIETGNRKNSSHVSNFCLTLVIVLFFYQINRSENENYKLKHFKEINVLYMGPLDVSRMNLRLLS